MATAKLVLRRALACVLALILPGVFLVITAMSALLRTVTMFVELLPYRAVRTIKGACAGMKADVVYAWKELAGIVAFHWQDKR